ncbi:MAG: ABC transporter ATP-binding protein [Alphaproteobacteria bacterium]
MKNSSIKTVNLAKSYGKYDVLKNISVELPSNGIFGILGKNGAGKTTFLASLMGLITPSEGEIYIFGKSFQKNKYEILKNINFQSPYVELPKKMTVIQNLIFYARLYDVKNFRSKISVLSSDLEINDLLEKNYGMLSSGQKTRVNLCKALLNNPKLLLLDEPTASLDISTSEFIRDYILNYQKKFKATIIITSHNLVEIEKMCSQIIILEKGKIFYCGYIKQLMKDKNYNSLKDLFINNG